MAFWGALAKPEACVCMNKPKPTRSNPVGVRPWGRLGRMGACLSGWSVICTARGFGMTFDPRSISEIRVGLPFSDSRRVGAALVARGGLFRHTSVPAACKSKQSMARARLRCLANDLIVLTLLPVLYSYPSFRPDHPAYTLQQAPPSPSPKSLTAPSLRPTRRSRAEPVADAEGVGRHHRHVLVAQQRARDLGLDVRRDARALRSPRSGVGSGPV